MTVDISALLVGVIVICTSSIEVADCYARKWPLTTATSHSCACRQPRQLLTSTFQTQFAQIYYTIPTVLCNNRSFMQHNSDIQGRPMPTSVNRRDQIMAALLENKRVSVSRLALDLAVSEATVRRDLRRLASEEDIQIVHGGATLCPQIDYSFHAKSRRNPDAKQVIGRMAAQLATEDDHLFVDSGTTCLQMAPQLRMRKQVSVIATSVRLASELSAPGVNVVLLGGQFRPARMDTVGPLAVSSLDQLRGYVAFIGADGLSTDFGPSASDMESAHLHQIVVRNARETVLLVDSSKFAAPSLYRIASWDQIKKVITESPPPPEWCDFFQESNIEIIHPVGDSRHA